MAKFLEPTNFQVGKINIIIYVAINTPRKATINCQLKVITWSRSILAKDGIIAANTTIVIKPDDLPWSKILSGTKLKYERIAPKARAQILLLTPVDSWRSMLMYPAKAAIVKQTKGVK